MNKFLASLEITFRRDPTNYRPRVNKKYSVKDREQKGASLSSSTPLSQRSALTHIYNFVSVGQLLLPRGMRFPHRACMITL